MAAEQIIRVPISSGPTVPTKERENACVLWKQLKTRLSRIHQRSPRVCADAAEPVGRRMSTAPGSAGSALVLLRLFLGSAERSPARRRARTAACSGSTAPRATLLGHENRRVLSYSISSLKGQPWKVRCMSAHRHQSCPE